MEFTDGDMVAVGEILIQPQWREVVVSKDPGLQGLDHQSCSDGNVVGAGMDIKKTNTGNAHHFTEAEAENLGKSVYFDEGSDSTDEWSLSKTNNGAAESDVKQKTPDANQGVSREDEISPEISHEQEIKPESPSAKVKSKHVKLEDLIEERDDDEDVIELEFEREIKSLDTHTMHCPKCNAVITRVVLRKRRTKKGLSAAPPQPEPVDLLGCLSCCSVFVPSGNCFSWIRLLANGGEDSEEIPQQTNLLASGLTGNDGNLVIDNEGACFSLFRIFGNKPEKKSAQKPPGQSSDVSAQAVGNTITDQEDAQAQDGNQNLDRTPEVQVDQNVALPDQNGSAYPKPPLSMSPVDVIIDLGEHVPNVQVEQNVALPVQNGDGTDVAEESGAIPGIIHEPRGEMPTRLKGTGESKPLEIVKSIVYGGLMEFITSLSIVTSAAASGVTTLNLLTIGLANLISGLIIFGHHLWDLKSDQCEGASSKYQEKLGKKENFLLHAPFAVLSFLVFGLIPPATYGYAFDKMKDKNLTLGAVAVAALLCIIILASCKAYIKKSDKFSMYIKTIMYYICIALMGSGVSYEVGDQINKLIENYSWVEKTPAFHLSLPGVNSKNPVFWASY